MCVNDTMIHVRVNVCVYICVCHMLKKIIIK